MEIDLDRGLRLIIEEDETNNYVFTLYTIHEPPNVIALDLEDIRALVREVSKRGMI